MKRIAFISDDRYISKMACSDVENAVANFFPDQELHQLSTNFSFYRDAVGYTT